MKGVHKRALISKGAFKRNEEERGGKWTRP